MNAIDLVRSFLDVATPGPGLDPDRIRPLLAEDFVAEDVLMGSSGRDEFVAKIRHAASAGGGAGTEVVAIVGDDEVVAALTRFRIGSVCVTFCQWFWVGGGLIRRQQVVYDPRAFLAMRG